MITSTMGLRMCCTCSLATSAAALLSITSGPDPAASFPHVAAWRPNQRTPRASNLPPLHTSHPPTQTSRMIMAEIVETDLNATKDRKEGRSRKRSSRQKSNLKLKTFQQTVQPEIVSQSPTHCDDCHKSPLLSPFISKKHKNSKNKASTRKASVVEVVTTEVSTSRNSDVDRGVTKAAAPELAQGTDSDHCLLTSQSGRIENSSNGPSYSRKNKWRRNFVKNEGHEKIHEQVVKSDVSLQVSICEQRAKDADSAPCLVKESVEHSVLPKKKYNKKKNASSAKPKILLDQGNEAQLQQQTERQEKESVPNLSAELSSVVDSQSPPKVPSFSTPPPPDKIAPPHNRTGKKTRSIKSKAHGDLASLDKSLASSARESPLPPIQVVGEVSSDQQASTKKDKLIQKVQSQNKNKKRKGGKSKKVEANENAVLTLNAGNAEVTTVAVSPECLREEVAAGKVGGGEVIDKSESTSKKDSCVEMKGQVTDRPNVSPITIGSSATTLLEEATPSECNLEESKLNELSPQLKEVTTSMTGPAPSPIHQVFTNAAGAAILRTISCSGNVGSCSSSVSSNLPLTSLSVSPSHFESGVAPSLLQPQYVPGKIYTPSSHYGNARMYPFSVEINDRIPPYIYSEAGYMFMPVLPEGYYPPPAVLYPYGKVRYETPSPIMYQQQHYYPQDMSGPSETSGEGMNYANNFGQDYWGAFHSNRVGPPLPGGPNSYHYLNVEAPEFNPTRFRLQ